MLYIVPVKNRRVTDFPCYTSSLSQTVVLQTMLHIVPVTIRRVTDYLTHRPCYKTSCYRLSMLHIVLLQAISAPKNIPGTNARGTNRLWHKFTRAK